MLFGIFDKQLNFWTVQIGGWLVYFVMIYITFLSVAPENSFLRLLEIKAARAVIGFGLTGVLRLVYKQFKSQLRIQTVIALVLLCSIVFGCAWTAIEGFYNAKTSDNFVLANFLQRFPRLALDYAMTITAWSALYFGVKNWLAWQRERENAIAATVLADRAQLEMLRYQLNPHFLFNSLNSIRALIDEDAPRARQMVLQLAEFLRYSLLNADEKETSLRREIEAAQNYLAIEKIRFEEKLNVEFAVEKRAEDLPVPCFLLNPLVENAVKHNLNNTAKPLTIRISAKVSDSALWLEVANSGSLKTNEHAANNASLGLRNVCERLGKLFPGRSQFELREENGWVKAQIKIVNE